MTFLIKIVFKIVKTFCHCGDFSKKIFFVNVKAKYLFWRRIVRHVDDFDWVRSFWESRGSGGQFVGLTASPQPLPTALFVAHKHRIKIKAVP